jgi:hypothetical protein
MGRVCDGFLTVFFDFELPEAATCQIMDASMVAWSGIAALIPPASARLVPRSSAVTDANTPRMGLFFHFIYPAAVCDPWAVCCSLIGHRPIRGGGAPIQRVSQALPQYAERISQKQ